MNHSQQLPNHSADMYAMHQLFYSNACGIKFGHQSYVNDSSIQRWFLSKHGSSLNPYSSLIPSFEPATHP